MAEALASSLRQQPRWKAVGPDAKALNRAVLTVKAAGPTLEGRFFVDVQIHVLHMGSSSMDDSSSICRDISFSNTLTPFGTGDNAWFKVSDASTGADFRWQMKQTSVHVFCVNGLGTHMIFVPATQDDARLFERPETVVAKSAPNFRTKNTLTRDARPVSRASSRLTAPATTHTVAPVTAPRFAASRGCCSSVTATPAIAPATAHMVGTEDLGDKTKAATCPTDMEKEEKTFIRTLQP